MRKSFFFIVSIVGVSFFSGCDCFSSCYITPQFAIVDKSTMEDLITGPNPRYFKDSLMQKMPSDSLFYPVSDSFNTQLRLLFNDTVLLKLNNTDIDTVVVYYSKSKGDRRCCGGVFLEPQTVFYNGVVCGYHGNIFLFEK
jgi:hypothetical protein